MIIQDILMIAVCTMVTTIQSDTIEDTMNNNINVGASENEPHFRLLKYRDVYELAKKRLHNPLHLEELAKKLKKMDKTEMMYKRQRDTGDSEYDATAEKQIQNLLPDILHQYGVLEVDETWHSKPMHFEDVRLQRIWQLAIDEANYNGDELRELHNELHAMQKKLSNYIWTVRQLESLKEKENNETNNYVSDDVIDNSVDGKADEEEKTNVESLKSKVKNEFGNLDEEVFALKDKVAMRIKQDKLGELTDSRVRELMEKAKEIMLEKDLQKFKSELDHFQNRISKLEHWRKVSENLRKHLEENQFEKELVDEYQFSKAKVKELTKFVKKYHTTLYNRLYKNYKNEL